MVGNGGADQRLVFRRHGSIISVGVDRFVAVVMLGDLISVEPAALRGEGMP
jgi:hypothetical protein